jgi:hypothetical protein
MNDWILLDIFATEIDTAIATGRLEAEGIPTQSKLVGRGDALLAGVGLQNGPRHVFVRAGDVEKARKILAG